MYSTYARLFIGFEKGFSTLITKYSQQSSKGATEILPITMLTPEQVNQALSHPHNKSLKELIAVYKNNVQADHKIIKSQTSIDEQKENLQRALTAVAEKSKRATAADKAKLQNSTEILQQQLILIQPSKEAVPTKPTLQDIINKNRGEVSRINEEFDKLSSKQDTEWEQYRKTHLGTMRTALTELLSKEGLPSVSASETDNPSLDELQYTENRYIDLASKDFPKEQMDKMLGLNPPDFDSYFKVKAYLALRSVNPPLEARAKLMQKLDPVFLQAKTDGQALFEKHRSEINKLNETKMQPVIQATDSVHESLTQLAAARATTLKNIAVQVVTTRTVEPEEIQPQVGPT